MIKKIILMITMITQILSIDIYLLGENKGTESTEENVSFCMLDVEDIIESGKTNIINPYKLTDEAKELVRTANANNEGTCEEYTINEPINGETNNITDVANCTDTEPECSCIKNVNIAESEIENMFCRLDEDGIELTFAEVCDKLTTNGTKKFTEPIGYSTHDMFGKNFNWNIGNQINGKTKTDCIIKAKAFVGRLQSLKDEAIENKVEQEDPCPVGSTLLGCQESKTTLEIEQSGPWKDLQGDDLNLLTNDLTLKIKQDYLVNLGITRLPRIIMEANQKPGTYQFRYKSGQTNKYEEGDINQNSIGGGNEKGIYTSDTFGAHSKIKNKSKKQNYNPAHYGLFFENPLNELYDRQQNYLTNLGVNHKNVTTNGKWAHLTDNYINQIYKNGMTKYGHEIFLPSDTFGGVTHNITDFMTLNKMSKPALGYTGTALLTLDKQVQARCSLDSETPLKLCVQGSYIAEEGCGTGVCNTSNSYTELAEDYGFRITNSQGVVTSPFAFDGYFAMSGTCGGVSFIAKKGGVILTPTVTLENKKGVCNIKTSMLSSTNSLMNSNESCGKKVNGVWEKDFQISSKIQGNAVCKFTYKYSQIPDTIEYSLNDYVFLGAPGTMEGSQKRYDKYDYHTISIQSGQVEMDNIINGIYWGSILEQKKSKRISDITGKVAFITNLDSDDRAELASNNKEGRCIVLDDTTNPLNKNQTGSIITSKTCNDILDCCGWQNINSAENIALNGSNSSGGESFTVVGTSASISQRRTAGLRCNNLMKEKHMYCITEEDTGTAISSAGLKELIEQIIGGSQEDRERFNNWTSLFFQDNNSGLDVSKTKPKVCNNTLTKQCKTYETTIVEQEPCFNQPNREYKATNISGQRCVLNQSNNMGTPVNCGLGVTFKNGKCQIPTTICIDDGSEEDKCMKYGNRILEKLKPYCLKEGFKNAPLNQFEEKYTGTPGDWSINGTDVYQDKNVSGDTMFLVPNTGLFKETNEVLMKSTLKSDKTNDSDNIGYVVGYKDKNNYITFYWDGASAQGGNVQKGAIITQKKNGVATKLKYEAGVMWNHNELYDMEIDYKKDSLKIYINGEKKIEAIPLEGEEFPIGRYGMSNNSQAGVFYGNIEINPCVEQTKICDEGYEINPGPFKDVNKIFPGSDSELYSCKKEVTYCLEEYEGDVCTNDSECFNGGHCIPNITGMPTYLFELLDVQSEVSFQKKYDWANLEIPNSVEELDIGIITDVSGSIDGAAPYVRKILKEDIGEVINYNKVRLSINDSVRSTDWIDNRIEALNAIDNVRDGRKQRGDQYSDIFGLWNKTKEAFEKTVGNLRSKLFIYLGDDTTHSHGNNSNELPYYSSYNNVPTSTIRADIKTYLETNNIPSILLQPPTCGASCHAKINSINDLGVNLQTIKGLQGNSLASVVNKSHQSATLNNTFDFYKELDYIFVPKDPSDQEDTNQDIDAPTTDFHKTTINKYYWTYKPIFDDGGKWEQKHKSRYMIYNHKREGGIATAQNLSTLKNPELEKCEKNIQANGEGYKITEIRGEDSRVDRNKSNITKEIVNIYTTEDDDLQTNLDEIKQKYKDKIKTDYIDALYTIENDDITENILTPEAQKKLQTSLENTYDNYAHLMKYYSADIQYNNIVEKYKSGHENIANLINVLSRMEGTDQKVFVASTITTPTGLNLSSFTDYITGGYDIDTPRDTQLFTQLESSNDTDGIKMESSKNKQEIIRNTNTNGISLLRQNQYLESMSGYNEYTLIRNKNEINIDTDNEGNYYSFYLPIMGSNTNIKIEMDHTTSNNILEVLLSNDKVIFDADLTKGDVSITNTNTNSKVILQIKSKGIYLIKVKLQNKNNTNFNLYQKSLNIDLEEKSVMEVFEKSVKNAPGYTGYKDYWFNDTMIEFKNEQRMLTSYEELKDITEIPQQLDIDLNKNWQYIKKEDYIYDDLQNINYKKVLPTQLSFDINENNILEKEIFRKKVYLKQGDFNLNINNKIETILGKKQINTKYNIIVKSKEKNIYIYNTPEVIEETDVCPEGSYLDKVIDKCIIGNQKYCDGKKIWDSELNHCREYKQSPCKTNSKYNFFNQEEEVCKDGETETAITMSTIEPCSSNTTYNILDAVLDTCKDTNNVLLENDNTGTADLLCNGNEYDAVLDTCKVDKICKVGVYSNIHKYCIDTVKPCDFSKAYYYDENEVRVCMTSNEERLKVEPICSENYTYDKNIDKCKFNEVVNKVINVPVSEDYLFYIEKSQTKEFTNTINQSTISITDTNQLSKLQSCSNGKEILSYKDVITNSVIFKCYAGIDKELLKIMNEEIISVYNEPTTLMAYTLDEIKSNNNSGFIGVTYKPSINYIDQKLEEVKDYSNNGTDNIIELCENALIFDFIGEDEKIRMLLKAIREIRSMIVNGVEYHEASDKMIKLKTHSVKNEIKDLIFAPWIKNSWSVFHGDKTGGAKAKYGITCQRMKIKAFKIYYKGCETGCAGGYCCDVDTTYAPSAVPVTNTLSLFSKIRAQYIANHPNGIIISETETLTAAEMFDMIYSDNGGELVFKYKNNGGNKEFTMNKIDGSKDFNVIIDPIVDKDSYMNWFKFTKQRRCQYITRSQGHIINKYLQEMDKKLERIDSFIKSFLNTQEFDKCVMDLGQMQHAQIDRDYFNSNFITKYTSHMKPYTKNEVHWSCEETTAIDKEKKCSITEKEVSNNKYTGVYIMNDSAYNEHGKKICRNLINKVMLKDEDGVNSINKYILNVGLNKEYYKMENYIMSDDNEKINRIYSDVYGISNPYQTKICTGNYKSVGVESDINSTNYNNTSSKNIINSKTGVVCNGIETISNKMYREFIDVLILDNKDMKDNLDKAQNYSQLLKETGFFNDNSTNIQNNFVEVDTNEEGVLKTFTTKPDNEQCYERSSQEITVVNYTTPIETEICIQEKDNKGFIIEGGEVDLNNIKHLNQIFGSNMIFQNEMLNKYTVTTITQETANTSINKYTGVVPETSYIISNIAGIQKSSIGNEYKYNNEKCFTKQDYNNIGSNFEGQILDQSVSDTDNRITGERNHEYERLGYYEETNKVVEDIMYCEDNSLTLSGVTCSKIQNSTNGATATNISVGAIATYNPDTCDNSTPAIPDTCDNSTPTIPDTCDNSTPAIPDTCDNSHYSYTCNGVYDSTTSTGWNVPENTTTNTSPKCTRIQYDCNSAVGENISQINNNPYTTGNWNITINKCSRLVSQDAKQLYKCPIGNEKSLTKKLNEEKVSEKDVEIKSRHFEMKKGQSSPGENMYGDKVGSSIYTINELDICHRYNPFINELWKYNNNTTIQKSCPEGFVENPNSDSDSNYCKQVINILKNNVVIECETGWTQSSDAKYCTRTLQMEANTQTCSSDWTITSSGCTKKINIPKNNPCQIDEIVDYENMRCIKPGTNSPTYTVITESQLCPSIATYNNKECEKVLNTIFLKECNNGYSWNSTTNKCERREYKPLGINIPKECKVYGEVKIKHINPMSKNYQVMFETINIIDMVMSSDKNAEQSVVVGTGIAEDLLGEDNYDEKTRLELIKESCADFKGRYVTREVKSETLLDKKGEGSTREMKIYMNQNGTKLKCVAKWTNGDGEPLDSEDGNIITKQNKSCMKENSVCPEFYECKSKWGEGNPFIFKSKKCIDQNGTSGWDGRYCFEEDRNPCISKTIEGVTHTYKCSEVSTAVDNCKQITIPKFKQKRTIKSKLTTDDLEEGMQGRYEYDGMEEEDGTKKEENLFDQSEDMDFELFKDETNKKAAMQAEDVTLNYNKSKGIENDGISKEIKDGQIIISKRIKRKDSSGNDEIIDTREGSNMLKSEDLKDGKGKLQTPSLLQRIFGGGAGFDNTDTVTKMQEEVEKDKIAEEEVNDVEQTGSEIRNFDDGNKKEKLKSRVDYYKSNETKMNEAQERMIGEGSLTDLVDTSGSASSNLTGMYFNDNKSDMGQIKKENTNNVNSTTIANKTQNEITITKEEVEGTNRVKKSTKTLNQLRNGTSTNYDLENGQNGVSKSSLNGISVEEQKMKDATSEKDFFDVSGLDEGEGNSTIYGSLNSNNKYKDLLSTDDSFNRNDNNVPMGEVWDDNWSEETKKEKRKKAYQEFLDKDNQSSSFMKSSYMDDKLTGTSTEEYDLNTMMYDHVNLVQEKNQINNSENTDVKSGISDTTRKEYYDDGNVEKKYGSGQLDSLYKNKYYNSTGKEVKYDDTKCYDEYRYECDCSFAGCN